MTNDVIYDWFGIQGQVIGIVTEQSQPVIFARLPSLRLNHNTSICGHAADPWTTEINRNDALERSQLRDA